MNANVSRRHFLGSLASTAALTACCAPWTALAAGRPTPKALVGSNIYGWTQDAQREKKTLNIEDVISALRDSGYDYLENFMNLGEPEQNARFSDQLRAKGLQPVSLYTGARLHEANQADATVERILSAAKVCQKAGFQLISCNPDPIGREKTLEELKTQVKALTRLGEGLQALGLKLGIHHHMPEMANGAREFHYNFRNTEPDLVGFCYDVHWVWRGGVPPLDALKEYGNRVVTWHLRQSQRNIWCEDLSAGDIDYAAVADYARKQQLPRRFTVELASEEGTKITRSFVENHKRSREFVRQVFGA